ncbi:MAG: tetratricopeptide repeat protein [Thermoguttaceae bacterium]
MRRNSGGSNGKLSPCFCLLILCLMLCLYSTGCHWGRSFKPMTPTQLLSRERSRAGIAAMDRGDLTGAEKHLEEAVRLNKHDLDYRRHYAETLWRQGKYQESLEQLNEAIKRGGASDASLRISIAEKCLEMNRPNDALRHADEAIRLNSNEAKGWALRAKSRWFLASEDAKKNETAENIQANLKQSRNDYYRALSLSPQNRDILPELAAVQMLCKQPEASLATWQDLQEQYHRGSEPADIWRGKAEAYIALGRLDDATRCLKVAQIIEPSRPDIADRLQEVFALQQNSIVR